MMPKSKSAGLSGQDYFVTLKHGDIVQHNGIVSALIDILDIYVNENTQVEVTEDPDFGWIRIKGPDHN